MRLRKMSWVLIVWSVLMFAWCIAGAVNASNTCTQYQYQSACHAGAAIGVGAIVILWFIGFVVLSLIWFMSKPKDHS